MRGEGGVQRRVRGKILIAGILSIPLQRKIRAD
jgi:hypothetical protein